MKYNKYNYLTAKEAEVLSRGSCAYLNDLTSKIFKERKDIDDDKFQKYLEDLFALKNAISKLLNIISENSIN